MNMLNGGIAGCSDSFQQTSL